MAADEIFWQHSSEPYNVADQVAVRQLYSLRLASSATSIDECGQAVWPWQICWYSSVTRSYKICKGGGVSRRCFKAVHCSQRAQHLCEVEGLLVHFLCSGANDCSIVAAAAAVVSAAVAAVIVIGMISEVR
jgi:hypothetical protein